MRGLWDNEQPVSPNLLRSALALAGGFLALCSAVGLFLAVGSILGQFYLIAAFQVALGIAVPFSLWVALRMLADMLVVLNRSHDRLAGIEDALTGRPQPGPRSASSGTSASALANTSAAARASDDGPAYPSEE